MSGEYRLRKKLGDIGELDSDGYLFIRDRKKDMLIVGGYNVYPAEVEEVAKTDKNALRKWAADEPV